MFHRMMEFAGSWYPRRAEACEQQIRAYWEASSPEKTPSTLFGVVPHAGWLFSGRIAARVFQALEAEPPPLVVVLGGHLRPGDPVVAMTEGEWETPFGAFPIHEGFRTELETLPRVILETERRHFPDNSTELQLPFARYRFPAAELLPIRVPPGPLALEVGRRLHAYLAAHKLRAAVIASTDLTHYGDNYGFQPHGQGPEALSWVREVNDPAFIQAVETGDSETILSVAASHTNACSAGAVAALNELARADGLAFRPLAYATSAEAGPRDTRNFVGYVGGIYC